MPIKLSQLVTDVSNCLCEIDASAICHKNFQPGVGPYGEPQLLKLIAEKLNLTCGYGGRAVTKRLPDLLIRDEGAVEAKFARPFGDNGKKAENWSINLLHPYPGNESAIGDCYKLLEYSGVERKAIIVVGYEHEPAVIDLSPLFRAFELVAHEICGIRLSDRSEIRRSELIHPVHRTFRLAAWEVLGKV
jgi:hypothetical protein